MRQYSSSGAILCLLVNNALCNCSFPCRTAIHVRNAVTCRILLPAIRFRPITGHTSEVLPFLLRDTMLCLPVHIMEIIYNQPLFPWATRQQQPILSLLRNANVMPRPPVHQVAQQAKRWQHGLKPMAAVHGSIPTMA